MRKLLIACSLLLSMGAIAQKTDIALIPQPVSLVKKTGSFNLPAKPVIVTSNQPDAKRVAQRLASVIQSATGRATTVSTSGAGAIKLVLKDNKMTPAEGYSLAVSPAGVSIEASTPAGLFYGTQTLLQLLPPDIYSKTAVAKQSWTIPAVNIIDSPRFGWRGVMLDVARHFFTKDQVKEFIDDMVQFKFNMLHLHLTDDEGWRVEIKSLPKLTEVGAWRAPRVGLFNEFDKPKPEEPKTYGGFYTQDDVRELVKYAQERFVQIMPEVDMPGHSLAAVASYPELSATPGEYQVGGGYPFMIWPEDGGHFYGIIDNTLNPVSEKTYEFVDKVMTELAQLFPFGYIHMGGDECYHGFWEKSAACQEFMKQNNIKEVAGLQAYFVSRVNKIVSSKGKKMIGWDEILEGGEPSKDAAVMSWRGTEGGITAAKAGHQVVMSPNDYAYPDLYQGDPIAEPKTYSRLLLNKAYQFEPMPAGVDSKYILGGQCNLWSERLWNMRHAQYMLWPRGMASAEAVWSQPQGKNWNDFVRRTEVQFARFDAAEIKYSRSMYDPIFMPHKIDDKNITLELGKQIDDLTIYYTFDESFPDNFYDAYKEPLTIPAGASSISVVSYRGKQQVGKIIKMPLAELKRRVGIK